MAHLSCFCSPLDPVHISRMALLVMLNQFELWILNGKVGGEKSRAHLSACMCSQVFAFHISGLICLLQKDYLKQYEGGDAA